MDFKDTKAIYLQIADYVCEQILTKQWRERERILSVRELGINLEVNPNTVLRGYDLLQNEGIIYNKRGIGYFAAEDAVERVKKYKKQKFTEEELPALVRLMQLLEIDFAELQLLIKHFKN
ncbi:MAG: GntR family transcriptional regulator [Bacteroidales bacterium]|jgi:DNA-binding transcriptional regulator YhcF (GntR family)|nr:GntR family transcriptional regulator [Bacteroidales bacterium]